MKERLILLYQLSRIDKELNELNSLRGDIPTLIDELTTKKNEQEEKIQDLESELSQIVEQETELNNENDLISQKIDKNDNLLRAGAVKTNQEYNALAKEIDDAYEKIVKNENMLEKEIKIKKEDITSQLNILKTGLDEMLNDLKQHQETLAVLNEQTEEEERELRKMREDILPRIDPDDLEYYERINNVKFGDAIAVVRKGSCLGCFNSIPPQRVIEIRMAEKFFHCESCGRILISEEFIKD
jgi:predicted  nucleic acid-binding Zn-ribbon protein